jgi:hypothetical protein
MLQTPDCVAGQSKENGAGMVAVRATRVCIYFLWAPLYIIHQSYYHSTLYNLDPNITMKQLHNLIAQA